jgi:hypothetical protein
VSRKNSKSSIGSHGNPGDPRPGQTWKGTKNLSVDDREDPSCTLMVVCLYLFIMNQQSER